MLTDRPTNLYFYVGPGNNAQLVRQVLLQRENWQEADQFSKVHFRWGQTVRNFKFFLMEGQSIVNHFQQYSQLSDKTKLLMNLHFYCQSKHINVYHFIPSSFIIDFQDQFCDKQLICFLNFYTKHSPRDQHKLHKQRMQLLARLKESAFNGVCFKRKCFTFKHCNYLMPSVMMGSSNDYLWFAKPNDLNRGRGIQIFSTLQQLNNILKGFQEGYNQFDHSFGKVSSKVKSSRPLLRKTNSVLIQKYIQRPLLIAGRKFDIRVWALLTHQFRLFFFKEGYVRTSSMPFSTGSNDLLTHLTNNAVQSVSNVYSKFQNGNQLSFKQLKEVVSEREGSLQNIVYGMKQICKICFSAVIGKIDPEQRKFCFEIFGIDFMIDQDLGLWLIQVNTNPCIEQSSPLLKILLPRMLDDAFRLTVDKVFGRTSGRRFSVPDYSDTQNMWQFLDQYKQKRK